MGSGGHHNVKSKTPHARLPSTRVLLLGIITTMKRLDDENLRTRYDRQGMIQVLDRFSVQCVWWGSTLFRATRNKI